ncbi:tRNA1(Val) (adenine(37)-N6)-methyltransferase [Chitinophaga japonensis]|uniref:tRNA1(Val) (adenine(37)-N6)-methyltransferase n=1 Tax=Chitinophaga japonensis TaxID=104662 RepID=A0A562SN33_CHIJA|nr:methyltransferase [Chitinophaga japonensis]TWI82642.1 tRNA1Val (adenine37-N6)-methyltransferase [Chitinophaga japonensis]
MPNSYFRFKQFTVHQDRSAMKVCTDACIQGAFTARYLAGRAVPVQQVLDIGAGTGLLALMLAQQLPAAAITGIELDAAAAGQAAENFAASPWATRLQVTQTDVRYMPAARQYDCIITNPPFYEGSLQSSNVLRNQAMHATTLGYAELLDAIATHLAADGLFSVLLPYAAFGTFRQLAAAPGFFSQEILEIKQSPRHDYFRTVGIFSRVTTSPVLHSLTIYDEHNRYTPEFTALLKEYYLYL